MDPRDVLLERLLIQVRNKCGDFAKWCCVAMMWNETKQLDTMLGRDRFEIFLEAVLYELCGLGCVTDPLVSPLPKPSVEVLPPIPKPSPIIEPRSCPLPQKGSVE